MEERVVYNTTPPALRCGKLKNLEGKTLATSIKYYNILLTFKTFILIKKL